MNIPEGLTPEEREMYVEAYQKTYAYQVGLLHQKMKELVDQTLAALPGGPRAAMKTYLAILRKKSRLESRIKNWRIHRLLRRSFR